MTTGNIDALIKQLSDKDGLVREKARLMLVSVGKAATFPLIAILTARDQQTRWEAAKTLISIADPLAIPALIKALEDEIFDIRWLASEALIAMGQESIKPLLEVLRERSERLFLREEAHHVFKYILRDNPKANELNVILKPVIDALSGSASGIETPSAAGTALQKLSRLQNQAK
jgi:HEAT repeat protein